MQLVLIGLIGIGAAAVAGFFGPLAIKAAGSLFHLRDSSTAPRVVASARK
jgi:hypothetical protein